MTKLSVLGDSGPFQHITSVFPEYFRHDSRDKLFAKNFGCISG